MIPRARALQSLVAAATAIILARDGCDDVEAFSGLGRTTLSKPPRSELLARTRAHHHAVITSWGQVCLGGIQMQHHRPLIDSARRSALHSSNGGEANYDADNDDDSDDNGNEAAIEESPASSSVNGKTAYDSSPSSSTSKREMLKFAVPALGIYLTNPLLSNIDNAFVGRTVGAVGLAALSPATLCIDQMLYLFSFLSRAATALAARAYYSVDNASEEEARARMKDAASPALSVAVFSGALLSVWYLFSAPAILTALSVDPILHKSAATYIRWRGAIAWAAMAQSILLTIFMVTKDAVTPLKVIAGAAMFNVMGDALFCAWPMRTGCGGAAAATALATLISLGSMIRALAKKGMLPRLKVPSGKELGKLFSFTGPLLAITLTRMAGFVNMQRTAMMLGATESLAGYQLCNNLLMFFMLFGEPLSQLGQTKLPALISSDRKEEARDTFKSILTFSTFAAVGVGAAAYLTALLGSGMFTSSAGVRAIAASTAPVLFFAVSQTIVAIAMDGTMMASRDFGFMLATSMASFLLQAKLLTHCRTVTDIFWTFTIRLGSYALFCVVRTAMGWGNLGRAIRRTTGAATVEVVQPEAAA